MCLRNLFPFIYEQSCKTWFYKLSLNTTLHYNKEESRIFYQRGGFLFGSLTKSLHSISVDGSDDQKLADSKYGQRFSVSPDNQWVAWSELYKVYIAPLPNSGKTIGLSGTSKVLPVAQVAKDEGINIHWSTDSKTLYWTMGNQYFSDQLEEKILREKIATQEVLLNQFENLAEQQKGKVAEIEAQTKKMVAIIKQEMNSEKITLQAKTTAEIAKIDANAKLYSTKKEAEADLIAAQSKAKGDLLIKKAEAEGEKLRNDAMKGVGGSTIVALEAARNINLSNITVSTVDIDFLDLNQMAEKFGVKIQDEEEK